MIEKGGHWMGGLLSDGPDEPRVRIMICLSIRITAHNRIWDLFDRGSGRDPWIVPESYIGSSAKSKVPAISLLPKRLAHSLQGGSLGKIFNSPIGKFTTKNGAGDSAFVAEEGVQGGVLCDSKLLLQRLCMDAYSCVVCDDMSIDYRHQNEDSSGVLP